MYKLMLVDDEPDICEGLQKVVDMAALGFTVVGEARNGMEALELAESARPDVVITDIRMPIMDGLAMAAAMKKMHPTVRFVMLSGYDEFEYARRAIELTALRYLLKPISSKEITAVLSEVKALLDEEFVKARDVERLRASYAQGLPLLREALLSSLITGNRSVVLIQEAAARYGMKLEAGAYALAFLQLPAEQRQVSHLVVSDLELLSFAVENIAGEIIEGHMRHYLFHFDGMLAVLAMVDEGGMEGFSKISGALDEVCVSIRHYLQFAANIGFSTLVTRLSDLPACASQARFALDQAALEEEGRVLSYMDIVPGGLSAAPQADEHLLRSLGNSLRLGHGKLSESIVESLLVPCARGELSREGYRAFLLEIVLVFTRAAREVKALAADAEVQQALEALMQSPPVSRARGLFFAIIERFSKMIPESRATATEQLAAQAISYIRENCAQESLTIERVCRHLHISTSYFCALFKKETQKTFLQYVTELRMEKAMALLASGMKTSEIAQCVGISDPSYFGYIFRRHFGVSPSQARKSGE